MLILNFDKICFCFVIIFKLTNSDSKNQSVVNSETRSLSDHYNKIGPNFAEDFPQFTPFHEEDFINVQSDVVVNGSEHMSVRDKLRPFRNLMLNAFKKYKSSYLGNKTAEEYMKSITSGMQSFQDSNQQETVEDHDLEESKLPKKKQQKKRKSSSTQGSRLNDLRYDVGPGVNVSLDMERNIVSVNLDEDCLRDIFTSLARWDDDSDEGRGKKYDMMSKILPLFILPFLIQSAIIPFLVTKLKLMLVKSIMVGKIAIFLLVVSAFRNNQKSSAYEASPAYYLDSLSRRSEFINGYRVEGKPASWVT